MVDQEKVLTVKHGSTVTVYLKVECNHAPEGQVVIGFFTKNRLSQRIFGQNTLSLRAPNFETKKGTQFAKFSFEWPNVESGEYTITLGIGEIDRLSGKHVVQCWLNDFTVLSSHNDKTENGIFSVEIEDFAFSTRGKLDALQKN